MDEIDNLKKYLRQSEPDVNKELRLGNNNCGLTFDSLFYWGETPSVLYRLLPNDNVEITDNALCDSAYLSCTNSIDNFIDHVNADDIACLKIHINRPILRIVPNQLFEQNNDEGEFILPRNTRLHLLRCYKYEHDEFADFIENEKCIISPRELKEVYKINSITLYCFELAN